MITGWWYEHLNDATSLLPVERRIVDSFLYVFQSSVLFSARATSQEVMFTILTENWLTQIYRLMKTQDSRKVYTTTGPAAGGVWRLNPPPKVLLAFLPQDGQSLRSCKGILKDASNVHVISKPTRTNYYSVEQLLHQYSPTYYQTQSSMKEECPTNWWHAKCRLGRWQSNNNLESNEKEFPRAGLRAE